MGNYVLDQSSCSALGGKLCRARDARTGESVAVRVVLRSARSEVARLHQQVKDPELVASAYGRGLRMRELRKTATHFYLILEAEDGSLLPTRHRSTRERLAAARRDRPAPQLSIDEDDVHITLDAENIQEKSVGVQQRRSSTSRPLPDMGTPPRPPMFARGDLVEGGGVREDWGKLLRRTRDQSMEHAVAEHSVGFRVSSFGRELPDARHVCPTFYAIQALANRFCPIGYVGPPPGGSRATGGASATLGRLTLVQRSAIRQAHAGPVLGFCARQLRRSRFFRLRTVRLFPCAWLYSDIMNWGA